MAQRITPTRVVTVTKEGECHLIITLELNINLNAQNGVGNVSASVQSLDRAEVEEDNVEFTMPDFTSTKLVDFGKDN